MNKISKIKAIILIQGTLIYIGFQNFFLNPLHYMFQNQYDGLKNYFTFQQFLTAPISDKGFFHFEQMNYPYGEYLFYTDNTPLLATVFKLINQTIPLYDFNLAVFNLIWILNILLCSVLFYLLLKDKVNSKLLLVFGAIAFSWLNPQFQRLFVGHFNLSMSSFLLGTIFYLYKLDDSINKAGYKKVSKYVICIALLLFVSAFFHLYYLPILLVPIGGYILFKGGIGFMSKKKHKNSLWLLSIGVLGAVSAVYGSIRIIDKYYSFRLSKAEGYNYHLWKMIPEAIIHPYDFIKSIPFPIQFTSCTNSITYESKLYLGIFIISVLIIAIVCFIYKLFSKTTFSFKTKMSNNTFWVILSIIGFFSYAISLGNYIQVCGIIEFDNWLSPFYFLDPYFDIITQFRCLGRFGWLFFWTCAISSILIADYLIGKFKNTICRKIFLIACLILLSSDTYDTIMYSREHNSENYLNTQLVKNKFEALEKQIDFKEYQAILPIPFFHVGSENYDYTIDDQDEWSRYLFQLNTYSNLPLMASKMSRTAEYQAMDFYSIFKNKTIPTSMNKLHIDKPILVAYNSEFQKSFDINDRVNALYVVKEGNEIIRAFNMDTLMQDKSGTLYLSWNIQNNN